MADELPIIGIAGDIAIAQNGRFPGYRSVYVYEDYVTAIEAAGGTAIILPVTANASVITKQAKCIDGLLLTGGADVNPLFYQEEPLDKLQKLSTARDIYEMALVRAVIEAGAPVFAICRGLHILNVAYGGTLYQDISYHPNTFVKHEQQSGPNELSHTVQLHPESYLYKTLGGKVLTNSFHHQAIKDVAADFVVTASSEDGVIEALEKRGDPSILAVQWHPERMAKDHENMRQLFIDFVERAKGILP